MSHVIVIAKRALAVGLVVLALGYAGDWLRVWRLARAGADGPAFETLTFWIATPLKNGKLEVFYDQPQTEVCVRSLFPHFGRRPCWYARRERIRRVG